CISVDLPEPDGPMMAVNRPAGTCMLTPRSATTCASPVPYTFQTSTARAATAARTGGATVIVMVILRLDGPTRAGDVDRPGCSDAPGPGSLILSARRAAILGPRSDRHRILFLGRTPIPRSGTTLRPPRPIRRRSPEGR